MELWKCIGDIKGYEYFKNYLISDKGRIKNKRTGVIRKTFRHNYQTLNINSRNVLIHRLVLWHLFQTHQISRVNT